VKGSVKTKSRAHFIQFFLGNDDTALGLLAGIGIHIVSRRKLNKDKSNTGYQKEGDSRPDNAPCD
jgi:hypothetical protein